MSVLFKRNQYLTQTFSFTPPVDNWTQYTQQFTITAAGPFQITF